MRSFRFVRRHFVFPAVALVALVVCGAFHQTVQELGEDYVAEHELRKLADEELDAVHMELQRVLGELRALDTRCREQRAEKVAHAAVYHPEEECGGAIDVIVDSLTVQAICEDALKDCKAQLTKTRRSRRGR